MVLSLITEILFCAHFGLRLYPRRLSSCRYATGISIPFHLTLITFYYILSHYVLLHSLSFSIIHEPYTCIIRRELKYCCKYNIIVSHLHVYMHLYSVIDSMNSDVIPNSHMLLIQVSVLLLIRLPFTHSLSRN